MAAGHPPNPSLGRPLDGEFGKHVVVAGFRINSNECGFGHPTLVRSNRRDDRHLGGQAEREGFMVAVNIDVAGDHGVGDLFQMDIVQGEGVYPGGAGAMDFIR